MKFRTIYDEERPSPGLLCEDETLCLQYQAVETSIERLVKLANQNPAYLNAFNSGMEEQSSKHHECNTSRNHRNRTLSDKNESLLVNVKQTMR